MVNVEQIAEELLFDLELEGWWLHAQTHKPKPFPWVAAPSHDLSQIIPLEELVGSLNDFREPADRLTPAEVTAVTEKICAIRFFGRLTTAMLDPESQLFNTEIGRIARGEDGEEV